MMKCRTCSQEKEFENFYCYNDKIHKNCKACVIEKNKKRYIAKRMPKKTINELRFDSLKPEEIEAIQTDLNENSIRFVADKHKIDYQTLTTWIRWDKYPITKPIKSFRA